MPDSDANKVSARIGVIDRLITSNDMSINDLLNKGLNIEKLLKIKYPIYSSKLLDEIAKFKSLNCS